MGPHTTSDDPTRYRDPEELKRWEARDPIARYRVYLERTGVWTPRLQEHVENRSRRLRAELREAVLTEEDFDVTEMFDTVYADITPELARQRDELRAELDWEG